jgi:MFS superfamily sulfate permease-like transporter
MEKSVFRNLKSDFSSSIVVFLIAVPLCLGIALASGAPFFSGLIAGIVGGIVIGSLSNSSLSVSGPAAGLTAIVLAGITKLGSFEVFLVAVFLAGVIQLLLGFLKAGSIANYFPGSVIKGMLTAIGIIIILKQLPYAVGFLYNNMKNSYYFHKENHHEGEVIRIRLSEEVLFLNKASIKLTLDHLPENSSVIIDASKTQYIDFDVMELIKEFKQIKAPEKHISCRLAGFKETYSIDNTHNVLSEQQETHPLPGKNKFVYN